MKYGSPSRAGTAVSSQSGRVSAAQAEKSAFQRYEVFDAEREEQIAETEESYTSDVEKIPESSKGLRKRPKDA